MIGMRNLQNRIAIITGSSKGIGKEIALEFARQGAGVVVCGRDRGRVDAVVNEVVAGGGEAYPFVGALSGKSDGKHLVSETLERFGKVDLLVNNAGIAKLEPILEHTEKTWQDHIDIHMSGALFCAQAAAKAMARNGYGRIVNISTIAAQMANPGFGAYGSVKAALETLTKVMAVELAPLGITANCVAPGPVMNDQLLNLYGEEKLQERALTIPMQRLATVTDVVHAVMFFVLEGSGYITGQVLGVDGGARAAGCFTAGIYQQRKAAQG